VLLCHATKNSSLHMVTHILGKVFSALASHICYNSYTICVIKYPSPWILSSSSNPTTHYCRLRIGHGWWSSSRAWSSLWRLQRWFFWLCSYPSTRSLASSWRWLLPFSGHLFNSLSLALCCSSSSTRTTLDGSF